jgi:hypothetical protein
MIAEAKQSDFLLAVDSMGCVVDFHTLRHTTATWLIHEGNDAKTVQSVMRHSTIMLTLDLYGRLFPGAEAQAVAFIRHRFAASKEADSASSGLNRYTIGTPFLAATASDLVRNPANCREVSKLAKPCERQGEKTFSPMKTKVKPNRPRVIRTLDLRIRNPLLYPTEL